MLPEKIKIACGEASQPSSCFYQKKSGKPCCVVAVLGELCGIKASCWEEGFSCFNRVNLDYLRSIPFNEENVKNLQKFWDNYYGSESTANEDLLEFAETLDWDTPNV